jgi:hypothetical protein
MEQGKVDEVIHVLGLAREEGKRMAATPGRRVARGETAIVQEITRGRAT